MEGLAAMNEMCLQELVHAQEGMMPPTHQPLQPSVKGIDSTSACDITSLGDPASVNPPATPRRSSSTGEYGKWYRHLYLVYRAAVVEA